MSALKTLKDIKEGDSDYNISMDTQDNIRSEAIRWIKDENSQTLDSTDAWIKHFFDITEEDLQ